MPFSVRMRFELVDEVAESAQRHQLAIGQLGFDATFEYRLEQGALPLPGKGAERLQCRLADAALGRGDGADECGIVVLIGDQAQVADDVLDLGAIEKTLATGDRVRDALLA